MDQAEIDRDLLQRTHDGDESALAQLVDRHWETVLLVASQLLGSWDAAEDVAQETFIRLWERREEWGMEGSVRALLCRIARNASIDVRRRHSAAERAAERTDPPADVVRPDEIAEEQELRRAISDALSRLPDRRREVFVLVRYQGLSYRETAEALGLSEQTIANHMSLALADLREGLASFLT